MLKRQLAYPADTAQFYQAIRHLTWPMWLDSGTLRERGADYDILVADPVYRVICHGELTRVVDRDGRRRESREPLLDTLRSLLGQKADQDPLPFTGGAVGYLSYDYGRRLQGLNSTESGTGMPEAAQRIYHLALVLDHRRQQAWLIGRSSGSRPPGYWRSL